MCCSCPATLNRCRDLFSYPIELHAGPTLPPPLPRTFRLRVPFALPAKRLHSPAAGKVVQRTPPSQFSQIFRFKVPGNLFVASSSEAHLLLSVYTRLG